MATPHVAGVMALMVGNEGSKVNTQASKIYSRLTANMLTGILTGVPKNPLSFKTPNNFLQTGINAQNKGLSSDPYAGIPHDELKLVKDQDPEASPSPGFQEAPGYTDLSATVTGK